MEKEKKSFNLVTLIFIGIIIIFIIIGLVTYCMKSMSEETSTNTNEIENVGSEEDLPAGEFEETTEFDYAKIYPNEKLMFSKDVVSYEVFAESDENSEYGIDNYMMCLPVINLKFEEVEKINSKIEEFYNKNKIFYSNAENNSNEDNKSLPELYFNYTLVEGILNVEFYCDDSNTDFQHSYHIDIKNEKLLSNKEFLNKLGIGEEKLDDLINDSILGEYLAYVKYDKGLEAEYKSVEDFRNTIKYTNIDNKGISEKYEYDFEKICNFCNIKYYPMYYTGDLLYIDGISMPLLGGNDSPSNEASIHINLDRKYVFYSSYSFNHISLPEETKFWSNNSLPYINLDSEDAIKVNTQLQKSFDNLVALVEKNGGEIYSSPSNLVNVQDGREIFSDEVILNKDGEIVIDKYYTMDFAYTIINDEILSVFVEKSVNTYENLSAGNPEFLSYHFNIESGKLLSNEEFIEACGMKLEDFKENLNAKLDLVFNGDSSKIDYDINNLKITFYNHDRILSDARYDGYIEQELEMFSVIGENFPNYPYTWVDVYLEEEKDEEGIALKEENIVLDKEYIDTLIENYNEKEKSTSKKISDTKEAQYYLIDFENDAEPECVIGYNHNWYVYCKGYEKPILIRENMDYDALYEVKNTMTDEKRLIFKIYKETDNTCFENMYVSSIVVKDNNVNIIPVFWYYCDTEKENELRNFDDTMDEKQKEKIMKETHTLKYYYNDKYPYYYEWNCFDSSGYYAYIANDAKSLEFREQYDVYVKRFKDTHELIHEFKLK